MLDLENLAAWEAQDALLAALHTNLDTIGIPVDLGVPTNIQSEHVWIAGGVEGSAEYEETGNEPSRQAFTLTVHILCTFAAATYQETRTRFLTILAGVTAALSDAGFMGGAVDSARGTDYEIDEGRSGEGHRQLGLTLKIECDKW